MKTHLVTKLYFLFVMCILVHLIKFLVNDWSAYKIKNLFKNPTNYLKSFMEKRVTLSGFTESGEKVKYILQWTLPDRVPFLYMGSGRSVFIEKDCKYNNCFVTHDRDLLGDYTKFDVIAFNGAELTEQELESYPLSLPKRRAPYQKYVFASIESSHNYPLCSDSFDGFFNWTWTYKLDSDSKWGYIVVRDSKGNIIGPKKDMHWMKVEDMSPVPDDLRYKLDGKHKLAAWFVSRCRTKSRRKKFVNQLNKELEENGFQVDIFGECGTKLCSRENETICDEIVAKDYFFYLAFENAFSEDYVTEKLLRALQFNAIPVVYGGANYSRFMPDGIYLNARELGVKKLAAKMVELALDFEKYVEYFKWKNHYSFHRRNERAETNDYCGFCALLNNDTKVQEISVYDNFREWWNPQNSCSFS